MLKLLVIELRHVTFYLNTLTYTLALSFSMFM